MTRWRRFSAWIRAIKPVRVYRLYSGRGGNLSAAGMSFQALFATFAAVWVGFSIATIVVHGDPVRLNSVISFINTQVPGLIQAGGAIDPNQLITTTTLSITSIISLGVLAYTAINWLDYTRVAFRRMFGLPVLISTFVFRKLRDLALGLIYGVVIFASSILSFLSTGLLQWFLGLFGIDDSATFSLVVRVSTVAFVLGLDMVILATLIRVLSDVQIPRRALWLGSLYGAIAVSALKVGGGFLMGAVSRNPLLASFAVLVVLLLWFNLIARAYLLTVAWISVTLDDNGVEPRTAPLIRRRMATPQSKEAA